jgi:hypothetical protein
MEAVATTESLVPVSPLPPLLPAFPGPVLPVPTVPVVTLAVPVVVPMELDPQPDKTSRKKAPMRSERWPKCIPIQPIIERVQGYAAGVDRRVNCVTQWHVSARGHISLIAVVVFGPRLSARRQCSASLKWT